jgi:hypothetical protein
MLVLGFFCCKLKTQVGLPVHYNNKKCKAPGFCIGCKAIFITDRLRRLMMRALVKLMSCSAPISIRR